MSVELDENTIATDAEPYLIDSLDGNEEVASESLHGARISP